jgi:hypothetical protein
LKILCYTADFVRARKLPNVLAGSSDQEVTSPVQPASSDEARVVDMHGHPYEYYISQHSMDRLKSGQGICDEMVNFCLGLLQVEAKYTAAKESWAFTSSGLKYQLLDK